MPATLPRCSSIINHYARNRGLGRVIGSLRLGHPLGACLFTSTTTQGKSPTPPALTSWAPTQQLRESTDIINIINKCSQVLTSAFLGDPVYTWLLSDFPISEHERILPNLFRAFYTQASLNNGLFLEAGNFGCCGLLMPPGSRLENPWTLLQAGLVPALWTLGLGTFKRAMFELGGGVEPILKKALTLEEQRNHWYAAFIGTAVDRRREGLGSSILLHMQDRARSDGRPLCFEAARARNRDLYVKHGAKVIGEIVVGKGKVGADGMPKKQGEGIIIWPMVCRL